MTRTKSTGAWVGGAAFLAVVLLAGGWFLLVSPTRADAADVQRQTAEAQQQNELLEAQLASLKVGQAELEEHKAELAQLRTQVPRTLEDTALTREIEAIAAANGVAIQDIAVLAPTALVPVAAVPEPVAAPPAPAEGGTSDAETAVPVPAAPVGPTAPAGMISAELTVNVIGSPDEVTAFVAALQEATARLVLVTGMDISRLDDQGAQGGQEAIVAGDWQAVVRAMTFVLPEVVAPPAAPAVGAPAADGAVVAPGAANS